ncbi:MAG: prolipoprotein diacylglyceryl transferase [Spirochaetes bacterium]|nr:prolipoprotein diacylglyceryl transferase [Spirochaetota bacterium]
MIHRINPTIFSFYLFNRTFEIRWYGLMYVIGFILAFLWLNYWFKKDYFKNKLNIPADFHYDLILISALGVIIGGRLGYVFIYNFSYYIKEPVNIFKIWEGGMSFHGALIVTVIFLYLYLKLNKYDVFRIADKSIVIVPIGLFFGRIGNFINGELYGRPSLVPWAIIFPAGGNILRHPSQIYEAICEGLILFLILFFLEKRQNKYYILEYKQEKAGKLEEKEKEELNKLKNGFLPKKGFIFWAFITLYGLFRIFLEFFRQPDSNIGKNGFILGDFTMGQLLSLPMFLIGLVMLYLIQKDKIIYKDVYHEIKK